MLIFAFQTVYASPLHEALHVSVTLQGRVIHWQACGMCYAYEELQSSSANLVAVTSTTRHVKVQLCVCWLQLPASCRCQLHRSVKSALVRKLLQWLCGYRYCYMLQIGPKANLPGL